MKNHLIAFIVTAVSALTLGFCVETAAATYDVTPTPAPLALKTVDLVIFAGQSNMSGRGGDATQAPGVPADTGYQEEAPDYSENEAFFGDDTHDDLPEGF